MRDASSSSSNDDRFIGAVVGDPAANLPRTFKYVLGTSEAFLHAVATEDQLKRSNNSLVLFSFIYVVLNILLIQSAGAVGLIFANALNMIFRIIYSAIFIKPDATLRILHLFPSAAVYLVVGQFCCFQVPRLFLKSYQRERSFNKVVCFREHSD